MDGTSAFSRRNLRTPLPLRLTFAYADKILEMHERWGADRLLEDRQRHLWLNLSAEQYARLKK